MQVVLPEPFGPTRPSISPARSKLRSVERAKAAEALDQLGDREKRRISGDIDPPSLQQ